MSDCGNTKLLIIGGGEHCGVVVEAVELEGVHQLIGISDAAPDAAGQTRYGLPVLGGDEVIEDESLGLGGFLMGMAMPKSLGLRKKLYLNTQAKGLTPASVRHPQAVYSAKSDYGAGFQAMARVTVNPGAKIGDNVLLNTGCIIEHDVRIGSHSHIAPGAIVCGGSQIGEQVFIGAGAVICNRASIGAGAFIAAGAVVVKDVSADTVVMGVPGAERAK